MASVAAASAIQIIGDNDAVASTAGAAVIYDVESGAEQRVDVSATTTAAAAHALDRHKRRLRDICASFDIPFSTCSAGDSWEQVLLAHLGA